MIGAIRRDSLCRNVRRQLSVSATPPGDPDAVQLSRALSPVRRVDGELRPADGTGGSGRMSRK